MKGKLTILKVDGTKTVTELDRAATLDELQAAVGGYIETVPFLEKYEGDPAVAFCNEEGKLNGLPVNQTADNVWAANLAGTERWDVLVGDIVILTGDTEFMEAI